MKSVLEQCDQVSAEIANGYHLATGTKHVKVKTNDGKDVGFIEFEITRPIVDIGFQLVAKDVGDEDGAFGIVHKIRNSEVAKIKTRSRHSKRASEKQANVERYAKVIEMIAQDRRCTEESLDADLGQFAVHRDDDKAVENLYAFAGLLEKNYDMWDDAGRPEAWNPGDWSPNKD